MKIGDKTVTYSRTWRVGRRQGARFIEFAVDDPKKAINYVTIIFWPCKNGGIIYGWKPSLHHHHSDQIDSNNIGEIIDFALKLVERS